MIYLGAIFTILIIVLVLTFLVVIHELGHFLAAKWAGIRVKEFGIGYPPRAMELFRWQETIFSLNWIPFGGFVQMEGEDVLDPDEFEAKEKPENDDLAPFFERPWWKRMIVILAGATVNFVFGILAFSIVYSFLGIPQPLDPTPPYIDIVISDTAASEAGIPENVRITQLTSEGSEPVKPEDAAAVTEFIDANRGKTITLSVTGECSSVFECPDDVREVSVALPGEDELSAGEPTLGIAYQTIAFERYPWYEMIFRGVVMGLEQSVILGLLIVQTLWQLLSDVFVSQQVSQQLMGPVGIADQAVEQDIFSDGPLSILNFAGLLSVNLAIMNVLPIPALDGGRAVFIMLGRFIDEKRLQWFEAWAHHAGFIFLLLLILAITVQDILRLFS